MAQKSMGAILAEAASKLKKEARIKVLRDNNHPSFRIMLALALNPYVHWNLPEEDPAYTPNELEHDQESVLYAEMHRLYLFLKPNHIYKDRPPAGLDPRKRDILFIQLLEQVSREDAELLLAAKHKKLPVKLSRETIEEAYPGLLSWKPE